MVQYTYDAYGNTTVNTGSPLNNPYQYNAEYTDSSTGNQYLRARYYDPASGRFLTKDTYLGETNDPLSLNLYTYAQNNPINYVDPSGHFLLAATLIGLGVGALVGAGSNVYKQYKKNNNSFNNFSWGSFAKDTFIGGAVGAVGGAFGGMAYTGLAATFGTAAIGGGVTLTVSQTVGVYAFSSIASGVASRYVNANLNNAFYGTKRNAVKEAFNPSAMLFDGVVGGVIGRLSYTSNPIYPYGRPAQTKGQQATQRSLLERFKKFCDDHGLSKIGKQDVSSPVDLPEEQLLQQADDIANAANKATTYSPISPEQPLKENISNTFNGGTYTQKVLTEDTVMYRVSGGKAEQVGSYFSRTPQNGHLQSQLDLALNPEWGNTAENISKVVVPKGTTIYEGVAAPQDIVDSIGNTIGTLPGGGNQIYIPKVSEGWYQ